MLSGLCASVQAELDAFFGQLRAQFVRVREVSAQAFSKARYGFSAALFEDANQHLLKAASEHIDAWRWQGLRIVAGDGSRLRVATRLGAHLPKEHYAFGLFLPGPELTLHASLHGSDGCERQMLFEALELLQPGHDLLVLDRGYPAVWLLALLAQKGIDFCMRVDGCNWKAVRHFLASGASEQIITLARPSRARAATYGVERSGTRVRLIRDDSQGGTVRILMTSLLDPDRHPGAGFGDLYHRRWRIEEAFRRIKHRLRLEAVSGLSFLALQQDFAAKVLLDNLATLLTDSADTAIAQQTSAPIPATEPSSEPPAKQTSDRTPRKYACNPNRSYAFGALKPILAGCLLGVDHCLDRLPAVLAAILSSRCRIQPNRSYPRRHRTKPHLSVGYKPCL